MPGRRLGRSACVASRRRAGEAIAERDEEQPSGWVGADPPHLGHHVAPEDGRAHAAEPVRVGSQRREQPRARAWRSLPQRDAALSHPRPGRRGAGVASRRWIGVLRAWLQRAALLRLAGGVRRHLVHRGPHHSSGGARSRAAQRGDPRAGPPAAGALVVGGARAAGDGAARGGVPRARDRGLRHDRGGASDGVESAAAACAQAGLGGRRGGARGRDHGRRRPAAACRRDRGGRDPRRATSPAGYLANPQANATAFTDGWLRTGDQGWMDGDGYLRLTGRLKEIINRGGEKISPREVDEALARASGGGPGRHLRAAATRSSEKKWGRRSCCATERRRRRTRSATSRAPVSPPSKCRGAWCSCRDSQGRHRQDAAHRAGRKLGLAPRVVSTTRSASEDSGAADGAVALPTNRSRSTHAHLRFRRRRHRKPDRRATRR